MCNTSLTRSILLQQSMTVEFSFLIDKRYWLHFFFSSWRSQKTLKYTKCPYWKRETHTKMYPKAELKHWPARAKPVVPGVNLTAAFSFIQSPTTCAYSYVITRNQHQ